MEIIFSLSEILPGGALFTCAGRNDAFLAVILGGSHLLGLLLHTLLRCLLPVQASQAVGSDLNQNSICSPVSWWLFKKKNFFF